MLNGNIQELVFIKLHNLITNADPGFRISTKKNKMIMMKCGSKIELCDSSSMPTWVHI